MTKLCETCEYLRYCARSGIEEVGCDRYKKDTTTNEEWFCQLSTEEKADLLFGTFYLAGRNDEKNGVWKGVDTIMEWLKQPQGGES